jgi:hypothetical protein
MDIFAEGALLLLLLTERRLVVRGLGHNLVTTWVFNSLGWVIYILPPYVATLAGRSVAVGRGKTVSYTVRKQHQVV